ERALIERGWGSIASPPLAAIFAGMALSGILFGALLLTVNAGCRRGAGWHGFGRPNRVAPNPATRRDGQSTSHFWAIKTEPRGTHPPHPAEGKIHEPLLGYHYRLGWKW